MPGTAPHEPVMITGSPTSLHNHSPVRRRGSVDSNKDDVTRPSLARHSPTLVRSFDPNDPEVRERQRTMDVDMAMQLSRARRETLSTPSPFESHPSSIHHQLQETSPERSVFPVIIDEEEEEVHYRDEDRGRHELNLAVLDNEGSVDGDTLIPRRTRSDPSLTHTITHTSNQPSLAALDTTSPSAGRYGLPTYQTNTSRSNFDFSRMEDFAAVEKATLGLNSPVATRFAQDRFSQHRPSVSIQRPEALRSDTSMPRLGEPSTSLNGAGSEDRSIQPQPTDAQSEHESITRPIRHRKISQSNSARPRPTRKGIGGKISLFESAPTEPVPRLPPLLSSNLGATAGLNPYSDFVISATAVGPTHNGILSAAPGQGHDRPYRFSFYSNALSATIHARSLSELPAEGQSFEDLFTGHQPSAPPPPFQASTSNGNGSQPNSNYDLLGATPKDRPTSSLAFTPPSAPPGYQGHRPTPSDGASVYASSARRLIPDKGEGPPLGQGETDNTWWLDVTSPTDEEMKMLSKVSSIVTVSSNLLLFSNRCSISIH